jgi:hypothetical protein
MISPMVVSDCPHLLLLNPFSSVRFHKKWSSEFGYKTFKSRLSYEKGWKWVETGVYRGVKDG